MANFSNSRNLDLSEDALELASVRATALGLSVNDYIARLVVADALRANASDIQLSEIEYTRLLASLGNPTADNSKIKEIVHKLNRNGL